MNMKLTNNGELELIWLGRGGAFSKESKNTNLLIIKGRHHLMIDFGITGPQALDELEIEPTDVLNILPTHLHSDHVGGIEFLIQQNYWIGKPFKNKPKINLFGNTEMLTTLWHKVLEGGLGITQNSTGDDWQTVPFTDYVNQNHGEFNYKAMSKLGREVRDYYVGNIKIQTFRTNHIPNTLKETAGSIGIIIDDKIFYSGDTAFDKKVIEYYAPKSEIMFHEACDFDCAVHTNIKDLLTLPNYIQNKIKLVHCDKSLEQNGLYVVDDLSSYLVC